MTGADHPTEAIEVHILSHTHWDREWYQPAGRFRQRLIRLIDELLDDPSAPPTPFLLDGQAVVLDDYVAVRPDRAAAVAARLRDGSLEAGPWYVLADELIPSGEALIRNLLEGRRSVLALGAAPPPVLYSPDSFGHPAALPTLARGFGFQVAIVWRGYGGTRWPEGDTARWSGPDGSEVILYHLPPSGYEFGASLPTDGERAAERWREIFATLAPRSRTGLLLVPNGADHHARQRELDAAVDTLARAAAPVAVKRTTLRRFATALARRADSVELPRVAGELRDSYGYTWTLQGTLAARAAQKRRNAHAERLLARDAEPWSALARLDGAASFTPLVRAAWRALLLAHPHDTLCGCSIDEVARAMEARLDDAMAQASGIRDDAIHARLRHDAETARDARPDRRPVVLARNRAARPRGGVGELEIETFVADVPVGPGSGGGSGGRVHPGVGIAAAPPPLGGGRIPVQLLGRERRHSRIESPRHYPDDDLVDVMRVAAWLPSMPGLGIDVIPIGQETAADPVRAPDIVHAEELSMRNHALAVDVSAEGRVALAAGGVTLADLLGFEDVGERGDLYTHSPIGEVTTSAGFLGARMVHHGPLRAAIELRFACELSGARSDSHAREPAATMPVAVTLQLDAGSRFLRVLVRGSNPIGDHRFRIVLRTGLVGPAVWADAALGPVERRPIVVSDVDAAVESPPPTGPLHRYVSLFGGGRGTTVFSDGLAEYEATDGGDVAITMFRAVGELSRDDLPERPGHAGWPASTPEAQSLGAFAADLAIMPHGPRDADTIAAIEEAADDVLLPLTGTTLRSASESIASQGGIELSGKGLAFGALKESEDERWVVARCVNLLDSAVVGAWRPARPPTEAWLARLDESPLAELPIVDGAIPIALGPRGVHTVLLR